MQPGTIQKKGVTMKVTVCTIPPDSPASCPNRVLVKAIIDPGEMEAIPFCRICSENCPLRGVLEIEGRALILAFQNMPRG